ncbi:hypothetical protein [Achromobacter pestifer]
MGVIQFWIKLEELRERRFDNVQVTLRTKAD